MTLTVSRWNENWEEWEDTRLASPSEVLAEARRLVDADAAMRYSAEWDEPLTLEEVNEILDSALGVEAEDDL